MKQIIILSILVLSALHSFETIQRVDPKKMDGLWYEIARTYNSYEEDCVASSIEYVLDDADDKKCSIAVLKKIGAELIEYTGSIEFVEQDSMRVMDMTYFWFFTERYYVHALLEEYNYAVIGDANYEQVWIMSRKPTMPQEILSQILLSLKEKMDTKKFIYTPQDKQGRYR